MQVLPPAQPPEGRRRQFALLLAQVLPQGQEGQEIRARLGEPAVHRVGGVPGIGRALARVLDRQRGGDDEHLAGAAVPAGGQDHPPEPRVDGQVGELTAGVGQQGSAAGCRCRA